MSRATPENNSLANILKNTRYLLVDFDGPICSIFSGISASSIARELRCYLADTKIEIPENVRQENDPLEVLRFASSIDSYIGLLIEKKLREAERKAVESAQPTPGAEDLFVTCRKTNRHIGIVSNNSEAAIRKYLSNHDLDIYVDTVVGRDPNNPSLMKPSPYLLITALKNLSADESYTAFIGDSPSDIIAAQAAKISSIGYANKPGKDQSLAKADVVITNLANIVNLLET